MAQPIDPAQLELILKTMGIENFKEVSKELEKIGDEAKDVTAPLDKAKEALADTGDVTVKLKEKIADLDKELQQLATDFKGGLIDSEAEFLNRAKGFEAEIDRHTKALSYLEGTEDMGGGAGGGGFKGVAGAAVKAEKAIGMLVSPGGSLGRLPSMLEGVTGALGLAGGVGMAAGGLILAFESILPKIEKFIEGITGAADAAKRAADRIKEASAEAAKVAKITEEPTEEQAATAKAVSELLAGGRGAAVRAGISRGLTAQGFGLFGPQQEFIRRMQAGELPQTQQNLARVAELLQQQQEAVQEQANAMFLALPTNAMARQAVMGMPQVPEQFRTRLAQTTPEAREAMRREVQRGEEISRWAEDTYARQEAARNETIDIQLQFNKAQEDKRKKDEHEEKTRRAKQQREETKRLRESTPEAMRAREQAELSNTIMDEEREQNRVRGQLGGQMFFPQELEQIKGRVLANMHEAQMRGLNLGQLVDWAMAQQAAAIERGIVQRMYGNMNRHQMNTEIFGPSQ